MFYFFPQIIPKKKCKSIINRYLKKYKDKMKAGRVRKGRGVHNIKDQETIDESYRKTDVAFLLEQEDEMYPMVNHYINEANDLFFKYNIKYTEPVQFARYKDGGHYYWHQDFSPTLNGESRKLSLTMNLSDTNTYEGGRLEFFSSNNDGGYSEVTVNGVTLSKERVKESVAKQGSVIVFDSRDWHRVTPITKGIRYSIVCWTVGPDLV